MVSSPDPEAHGLGLIVPGLPEPSSADHPLTVGIMRAYQEFLDKSLMTCTPPPQPTGEVILANIREWIERLTPPKKILLCAPGRLAGIEAAFARAIAGETDQLLKRALERIQVRESDHVTGDEAILTNDPDDALNEARRGRPPSWLV